MTVETQTETKTARRIECPTCGEKAKQVSNVTLGTLLKEEFAKPFIAHGHPCCGTTGEGCKPINGDTRWRFCESTECGVVYFSEEGDTTFTKSQLNVPVGVKEQAGERPLCYCFGHSVASIKEELRTKGHSDALEDIRAKMKDPGCRCETENPSGSCCLGNVAKGIKTAQEESDASDVRPPTSPAKSPSNRGEMIAKIGTVVSAIMASACCWLPLVLLAVGVSGAGIASTLEAYRPLFMVVTFGFFGAAFYFTYRPRRATGSGQACFGSEATEVENCCAPATKGRFNIMTVNKVMLWGVTVLAVAFLFFPNYVGFFLGRGNGSGETATNNPLVRTTTFSLQGMTCEGCSVLVEKAIKKVPGVLSVKVDYERKRAVVMSEACCPAPTEAVIDAVQTAGYRATVVEADGAGTAKTSEKLKADCCEQPPPSEKAKADAKQIDPERQIVFAVRGFT